MSFSNWIGTDATTGSVCWMRLRSVRPSCIPHSCLWMRIAAFATSTQAARLGALPVKRESILSSWAIQSPGINLSPWRCPSSLATSLMQLQRRRPSSSTNGCTGCTSSTVPQLITLGVIVTALGADSVAPPDGSAAAAVTRSSKASTASRTATTTTGRAGRAQHSTSATLVGVRLPAIEFGTLSASHPRIVLPQPASLFGQTVPSLRSPFDFPSISLRFAGADAPERPILGTWLPGDTDESLRAPHAEYSPRWELPITELLRQVVPRLQPPPTVLIINNGQWGTLEASELAHIAAAATAAAPRVIWKTTTMLRRRQQGQEPQQRQQAWRAVDVSARRIFPECFDAARLTGALRPRDFWDQRHFVPWVYGSLNAALLRQLYGPPRQCLMHSHGRCHRSALLEAESVPVLPATGAGTPRVQTTGGGAREDAPMTSPMEVPPPQDEDEHDDRAEGVRSGLLRAWPHGEAARARIVRDSLDPASSWLGVLMQPPSRWSILQAILWVDSVLVAAGTARGEGESPPALSLRSNRTEMSGVPALFTASARKQVHAALEREGVNGSMLLYLLLPRQQLRGVHPSVDPKRKADRQRGHGQANGSRRGRIVGRRSRLAWYLYPSLPPRRFRALAAFEAAGGFARSIGQSLQHATAVAMQPLALSAAYCIGGLLGSAADSSTRDICCPRACGLCGGDGCSSRPVGRWCCRNGIERLRRSVYVRRGERPPASAAACRSAVEVGCIVPMVAAAARVSRGAAHGEAAP